MWYCVKQMNPKDMLETHKPCGKKTSVGCDQNRTFLALAQSATFGVNPSWLLLCLSILNNIYNNRYNDGPWDVGLVFLIKLVTCFDSSSFFMILFV